MALPLLSGPEQRLQQIIAKHRAGDHAAAETGYLLHLKEFPEDASALHFLGLLRTHQGRNEEAVKLMVAALEIDPEYVDAWSNLGIAYFKERDLVRAEFCSRKAIELAPDFANAWANLGLTLRARNASEEALVAWGRALDLQPGMRNIAISYGHLLYRLNRLPEALEFYGRWQASDPDDPIPQHMLAAVGGAERPRRASDGYVRATFDDFAESFDRNLEDLGYRAPQVLWEAVSRACGLADRTCDLEIRSSDLKLRSSDLESRSSDLKLRSSDPGSRSSDLKLRSSDRESRSGGPDNRSTLAVLDLGCGTGLCGPFLRPVARYLVGVDLSPNMLSKAAARAVYDQLNCGELTRWLADCAQRFDLAVAADVLCYFGDLSAAFANVHNVLLPGGHFACSLEVSPADAPVADGYVLRPHGRYQHERNYVEQVLANAHLQIVSITTETLRYERQDPVTGLLVVAKRPSAPSAK